MSRAVLSIGSNVGDSVGQLRFTVDTFGSAVVIVSPVYQTAPWGGVEQPDFLNAVLVVDGDLDAREWLARGQRAEAAAGRQRTVRWGPRSLDVDVISVDDLQSADPALTLPHPRAHERAFVLVPWLDVDAGAVLPGRGAVADLVGALDTTTLHRRDDVSL